MRPNIQPTSVEQFFGDEEIIVSKTDLKGILTYANEVFVRISGFTEEELLAQSHNIIRHPDMPRCVFALLWQTIASGQEIFAYVKNMCKNGDYYWVFAHVTPTFDESGRITGYHSNRRTPNRAAVARVDDLYRVLLAEERRHSKPKEAIEASSRLLARTLDRAGIPYEEFVFSISQEAAA